MDRMLAGAGFERKKYYSVLSGLEYPMHLAAENYVPNEDLANRIRQRTAAELDREKRVLGQMKKERLRRFLPLVDELSSNPEDKEVLAYLLDKFYWKEYEKNEAQREHEGTK